MDPRLAWVALVTLLSLLFYMFTLTQVGSGRGRYGVPAPAMTGYEQFERLVRVQANTLESLVVHLPVLWLCGLYLDARIAAGLGAVWIVGRVIYAVSYARDPGSRTAGFAVQAFATILLLLGALFGVARVLLTHGASA